jgi:hypothetical protein
MYFLQVIPVTSSVLVIWPAKKYMPSSRVCIISAHFRKSPALFAVLPVNIPLLGGWPALFAGDTKSPGNLPELRDRQHVISPSCTSYRRLASDLTGLKSS